MKLSSVGLEGLNVQAQPGLLTVPQLSENGFILGIYPYINIQTGDRFEATISCEDDAKNCVVLFRVSYIDSDGIIHDLWATGEKNDGKATQIDLDLTPLVGQNVKFVLSVFALNSSTDNKAIWATPRIIRIIGLPTSAPKPTSTPRPRISPLSPRRPNRIE